MVQIKSMSRQHSDNRSNHISIGNISRDHCFDCHDSSIIWYYYITWYNITWYNLSYDIISYDIFYHMILYLGNVLLAGAGCQTENQVGEVCSNEGYCQQEERSHGVWRAVQGLRCTGNLADSQCFK